MEEEIFIEPANYYITDLIFDFNFHCSQNYLVLGTVTGGGHMYYY